MRRPICSPGICGYFSLILKDQMHASIGFFAVIIIGYFLLVTILEIMKAAFQVVLCNPMVIQLQHYCSYGLAMNLRLMPWR